jgi:hypothetical protein
MEVKREKITKWETNMCEMRQMLGKQLKNTEK